MRKKNVAVIAIGNELMGDDGVGPVVLKALRREVLPGADLVDGGTGGISLLHIMKDYSRVIFVDAADFGGMPGEIKVFYPGEVQTVKEMGYSLHEADLLEIIHISQELQEAPSTILIVAIQPRTVEMGRSLSEEVVSAVPMVVKEIMSRTRRIED